MKTNRYREDSQFGVLVACWMMVIGFVTAAYTLSLNQMELQFPDEPPVAAPSLTLQDPNQPAPGEIRIAAARPVVAETTPSKDGSDLLQTRIEQMDLALSRLKVDYASFKINHENRQHQLAQQQVLTVAMATGQLLLRGSGQPDRKITIPLTWVPSGRFSMGQTEAVRAASAAASASSHFDFCVPSHDVHVQTGFFLGYFEITRAQFREFRGSNDVRTSSDPNYPITNVSFDAAVQYCQWLSQINGITVRLPTEIEFEYALRGNRHLQQTELLRDRPIIMGGPWPVDAPELDDSWCGAVGLNSNVQEWCIDGWDDKMYEKRAAKLTRGESYLYQGLDPSARIQIESARVVRGASFRDVPANSHPALRRYKSSDTTEESLGFRVVVPVAASLISSKGE